MIQTFGQGPENSDGLPERKEDPVKYEVIVSDLGTMYQGIDYSEAMRIYEDYAGRSRGSYGRISGKRVTLIDSARQILRQHKPCNVKRKEGSHR